jgi:DNA-binding transcriptional LysR family regulator
MACQMVRDGAGIAVLDRICAQAIDLSGLTLRPIEPERWISFGYIQQRGSMLSKHALHFLDCLNRVVAKLRSRGADYENSIIPLC